MRSVRISDQAYDFISDLAKAEHRSIVATLDRFILIFKEGKDGEELEGESLSGGKEGKTVGRKMDKAPL